MKKLLLILTLILTAIWAYTSWYWYTCSIKGFCNDQISEVSEDNNIISGDDVFIDKETLALEETASGNILNTSNAQKLSADDVLTETKIKKVEEKVDATEEKETETETEVDKKDEKDIGEVEVNITVLSGSLDTTKETDENLTKKENQNSQHILCSNPIVGPIGIGLDNNAQEVKNLEAFLASQGETVTVDGIYGKDEFEAMKRFQLKYREDILDPWDIVEPTGYVYTTTIKKIQALACQ